MLQAEMAVVKRIPLGEKGEKVVVEQAVTVSGGMTKNCQEQILTKHTRPTKGYFLQTSLYRTMAQTSTWQPSLAAVNFSCPGPV